jgi:hypothetical protein
MFVWRSQYFPLDIAAARAYSSDCDPPKGREPFLMPGCPARVFRDQDMPAQTHRHIPGVATARPWTLSSRRRLCTFLNGDYKAPVDARRRHCGDRERVDDRRGRGRFLRSRCRGGSV